jgi:DNA-binding transcriptional LysR family regulator
MRNVPMDLLRAYLAVLDLKGYKRAGDMLGRSQPAVSLQIKRLQELLGVPLFEREGSTRPSEAGEVVATYARRIVALNDELVLRLSRKVEIGRVRIGLPNDYADRLLPQVLARFPGGPGRPSFDVVCDVSLRLLRAFRDDELDLILAMTPEAPAQGASMSCREPLAWVAAPGVALEPEEPVRLIVYPEGCLYRQQALAALQRQGRAFEIVYTSPSLSGIEAALRAHFGITVLARRLLPAGLAALGGEAGLPDLGSMVTGLYVRPGARAAEAQLLASYFAEIFQGEGAAPAAA